VADIDHGHGRRSVDVDDVDIWRRLDVIHGLDGTGKLVWLYRTVEVSVGHRCCNGVATVSGPEDGVPGMDRMAIGGAEDRGISGNGSCREGAGGVRMGGTEEREISGNASCREGAGGVTVGWAERRGIAGSGS
jgi:hypothetical protein